MKGRDYKEFAAGEVYHIYNRGVGRMEIFRDPDDYKLFISRLKENLFPETINSGTLSKSGKRRKPLPNGAFDLICYCLMPNHFHLLIKQNKDLEITKLIAKICTGFSMYFNKKYGHVGAVFQDQFKAVRIQTNEQLLWVSYYIHNNPIQGGLVSSAKEYIWSSYSDYYDLDPRGLCKKDMILGQFDQPENYLRFFAEQGAYRRIQKKIPEIQDILIDEI